MESHEIRSQKGVAAPTSLLPDVMARLEHRERYLTSPEPSSIVADGLGDPRWEIRAAALRGLGMRADPAALTARLTALHDEHRLVRATAVRTLGRLGTRAPLDALLLALQDPDWEVREMVLLTLPELDLPAPDLLKALLLNAQQDMHANVREAANFALQHYYTQQGDTSPATEQEILLSPVSWKNRARRYTEILLRQFKLIHSSIWLWTPLFLILWALPYCHIPLIPAGNIHAASLSLALFTAISAATGTAFIFGSERDSAFELTLATPTSIRVVLLSRFVLVIGYNVLLAACFSALIALMHGNGFWATIQLWFGPMLLLSSLTLSLSLLIGSWLATFAALIVELSQTLVLNHQHAWPTFDVMLSLNWQTSPAVLALAIGMFVFAAFYAPRQPHLS